MEKWSAQGRAAIQDALDALRETVGEQLDNEVEQRLKEDDRSRAFLTDELEILRSRSAEVDRLEEENRKLRTKLLQFHQQNRSVESSRGSSRPSYVTSDQATNTDFAPAETPDNGGDLENVLRESHKLRRKYNALDQNFRILKAEFNKRRDERKEENKKWEDYATSLEAKIRYLEQRRGDADAAAPSAEALPEQRRPHARSATSFASDPEVGATTTLNNPWILRQSSAEIAPVQSDGIETQNLPATYPTEGETTEGNKEADEITLPPMRQNAKTDSDIRIKPEPSSDGPVIISERLVGKRKHPDDSSAEQGERRRIKMESSNLTAGPVTSQLQEESMDLDEVGQRLNTPRKNRLLANNLATPGQMDTERAQTAAPVFVRPDNTNAPTSRTHDSTVVLTPVNPNARPVRPYELNPVEKPTRKGLAQGIRNLAEDGIVYDKTGHGEPAGLFRTPQPPGRLSTLLNAPSPEKTPAIVRSAPRLRDTGRMAEDGPQFPERRELPFNKERRGRSKESPPVGRMEQGENAEPATARGQSRNSATAGPQLLPTSASLRSKPAASLRLEDFKVNPKFNGGSDYAYSEVVRNRDDRACLPGCTDMSCCGPQFRAMALAQRNNVERTPVSDTKLFEDYLGDRITIILGMSKAEKEDLWIEAKTWQLANELGKHRHRYARRPSPPGFWNADFPTTQEDQAETAEVEKREKQMIQERYREAMRGRGRWIFKDE
ncbi:DNA repair protein/CtIP [Colletotrichum orchidophilum]|uniref:DNA repair protein/CtIP n=1 Tax=Colletotrichum orchidophilum TaxID=1209926 RepID=A0A1G4ANX0_9PEZI|nr:DNA repair protein/CtIP [Colletotrichum orchidophilum]OHE90857.1 DNA repair protein/CtIP [Colletotrichum orchidophilum]